MAIEDFEWEGDIESTQPSQARRVEAAQQQRPSWRARLRRSVWLEPAVRLGGMAILLGALAGIGVLATTYAEPGVKLPEGPRSLAAALGSSWLKPTSDAGKDEHTALASSSRPMQAALPSSVPVPSSAPPANGTPAGVTAEGKVILNLASAEELTKLPGVGMKRAEAIVALRTKLKRFRQVTDLLRVKGIGPRGLKRMLPHLVLDAPV
ncbi:MAG TPA: helix-hairpin-helix domain-containing protein [Polyangiaceae bacterium]|nr:helix-hairpin-helix domain-containing protein [Polyangiaceae bacterium]